MIKKIILTVAAIAVASSLLLGTIVGIALNTGQMSRSDLDFLIDLGKKEGIGAVVYVVRTHIQGPDLSNATDPSYGREHIAGRGNAPWVIRGNLDGHPRMLKFALAPDLWAAYDVESLSVYQVWEGKVLFEGAAYDYQHGPQPASEGAWFIRNEQDAKWFLEIGAREVPATIVYRGHEYTADRTSAGINYDVVAQGQRVSLREWPDIVQRDSARFFTRRFETRNGAPVLAGFYDDSGNRFVARDTIEFELRGTTPIERITGPGISSDLPSGALSAGEQVISQSDCLGCHAQSHKISGPSWEQLSGKFRGKIQQEVVDALAAKVKHGSVGNWGKIPMPAHPDLSDEEIEQAVQYILSVGEPDAERDPPRDVSGAPYPATDPFDFDTLPRLDAVHPSFTLENLAPAGFEPKVGGMEFRSDGKMVLASWDLDGAAYLVDPNAPEPDRIRRIAEGLHEPLGLTLVDDRIFVLQKQELTELIDRDGDEVIDEYRAVNYSWPSNANFHSFAFGLEHRDNAFYFLLSICVLPGGASCPEQLPTQGKLLRADMQGGIETVASGFRTPNGITQSPEGSFYVTDNQGDWLPASKLVKIADGAFYGSRAVPDEGVMGAVETPPVVWLPQDEVGNSPTQPLFLQEPPYTGQVIFGDVYNGGIKRVFLEEVAGAEQGAAFHFSAGFQGAVNRLERGPTGDIFVGEVGNPPNWGEYGKPWHGFERLRWAGNNAFEMLAVRARENGFEIELTQPLSDTVTLSPDDLLIKQWFYHPNEQYGGPKYDESDLRATAIEVSADRKKITARIPGLKAGYVVYLRLNQRLRSASGSPLWTAEAWYTLNNIPGAQEPAPAQTSLTASTTGATPDEDGWRSLFDGETLDGWRNYAGDVTQIKKWHVEDGSLSLQQRGRFPMWDLIRSVAFGGPSGDLIYYREKFENFELSLEWKISENGNSGIFYLVADEEEKTPWHTGIEMQVLHNEGHADGKIETHRAGDLYDLIAAHPETVKPPGQWNEARIRIQNNQIEHWLNGVKVVSVKRGSERWNELVAASKFADMPRFGKAKRGYIVLQDHGDPVWYRNIRVRTLADSE